MITKHFSQLCRHNLNAVIRSVAVGRVKNEPYIAVGCIDCNLYIFDKNCHLIQTVTFGNWVRCCAMGDIDGDGDAEILAGSGDKTVKILKFIGGAFQELRSLDFPHIVNACAIADVRGNGIPEIFVGTWGSIVYALDARRYDILWQKEFQGWINFIVPGDVTWSGRTDLLLGTRDGLFYVVEGADGHIIWEYKFPKEINSAAIADVDNSGTPSILVGGNSEFLTIFNSQGNILREIPMQNRVISMAVGDVDGDHANEIVLGCGDNTLRVLENSTRSVDGITLKWRGIFENTIRSIQICDLFEKGVNNIVFGGYNKILQAVEDFQWGQKSMVEIVPVPRAIPPVQEVAPQPQLFVLDKIIRIEDLLANSAQELVNLQGPRLVTSSKSEDHSASVEDFPQAISSPYELLDHVITPQDVEAAENAGRIPRLPSKLIPIPPITPITPVAVETGKITPPPEIAEVIPATSTSTTQYCEQVVDHLRKVGVISSKAKLVEVIKSIGIPEEAIQDTITKLQEDQRLTYSRKTPRGYILSEGVTTAPVQAIKTAKRAKPVKRTKRVKMPPSVTPILFPAPGGIPVDQGMNTQKAMDTLKTAGTVSSKVSLFLLWTQAGIPDSSHEQLLEDLRSAGKLEYHKTSPRGYRVFDATVQAAVVPEKPAATGPTANLSAEIERAYSILKAKGLIPSKPEVIKVLEKAGIAVNLAESILNNLKESGRLKYSRSTPRGYSAV